MTVVDEEESEVLGNCGAAHVVEDLKDWQTLEEGGVIFQDGLVGKDGSSVVAEGLGVSLIKQLAVALNPSQDLIDVVTED